MVAIFNLNRYVLIVTVLVVINDSIGTLSQSMFWPESASSYNGDISSLEVNPSDLLEQLFQKDDPESVRNFYRILDLKYPGVLNDEYQPNQWLDLVGQKLEPSSLEYKGYKELIAQLRETGQVLSQPINRPDDPRLLSAINNGTSHAEGVILGNLLRKFATKLWKNQDQQQNQEEESHLDSSSRNDDFSDYEISSDNNPQLNLKSGGGAANSVATQYGSSTGEYIDHPLALVGHQYVQGGAGEGRQLLGPDGSFENVQVIKSDHAVPSYCDPPNPCPIGYTAEDGCLEKFINSASFSREYQAKQQCSCDDEHSLFNCGTPPSLEGRVLSSSNDFGAGSARADAADGGRPDQPKPHADLSNSLSESDDSPRLGSKLDTLARTIQNRFGSLPSVLNLVDEYRKTHPIQDNRRRR